MANLDAFVFEQDRQENIEIAALYKWLQGLKVIMRAKVTKDRVITTVAPCGAMTATTTTTPMVQ